MTRKRRVVAAAGAMTPPLDALAPAPRRKTIWFVPESNSAWSSPDASVFEPAFAPLAIWRLPGKYVERPAPAAVWVPGHWVYRPFGYVFVPGHWL